MGRRFSCRTWGWHRTVICGWFISSLTMGFFISNLPWRGGTINIARGEVEGVEARQAYQAADIYAALKANDVRLNDASVWKLARSIQKESEKHSLDPLLVLAVIKVESRFDHKAVSAKGARGLMQVQPVAAAAVLEEAAVRERKTAKKIDDPIINVKIGTAYLKHLKEMFGDITLALIAYNWGPTKLRQTLTAKEAVPLGYAQKVFSAQRLFKKHWGRGNSIIASERARVLETRWI
jgi:soluble lytic murein transglycosylase-like protein